MKIAVYILLFYFSLGAMLPKSDFSQFLKFANLVEHYELHQLEAIHNNEVLVLTEFLYEHFISTDEHQHPNDDDNDEHKDLPFQSIGQSISIASTLQYIEIEPYQPFVLTPLASREAVLLNGVVFDIFHPPIFRA